MPNIKVTRFRQKPSQCGIASASSIINYYDKEIDYEYVEKVAKRKVSRNVDEEGMDSGEIGYLFNVMGFKKVTIVSSNLDLFDYSFNKYGRKKQANILSGIYKYEKGPLRESAKILSRWLLREGYNNKIVVDYNFGHYIRKYIKEETPFILSYNWEMFFRCPKTDEFGQKDIIRGGYDEHVVVAYGCNKYGVNVCDSHWQHYKYKLKKYQKGFYRIPWEHLMSIMGTGDLIIPENFEYGIRPL